MKPSPLVFTATLFVLALPLPVLAQTAERIRVQPRTVWAQRGRAILQANAAAMRAAAPEPTAVLSGTLQQVAIPVAFADEPLRYSPNEISDRFYGPGTPQRYSLSRYFDEMSGGAFGVTGVVTASVQLSRTSASYTGTRNRNLYGGVADDLPNFIRDVLQFADLVVDWSLFVEEGSRTVPAVIIITAGPGGHCPGDASHIWPHRWHMTGLFGAPFETSSKTPAGETILIDDYIVQPSEECAGGLSEIGVLAHETGHLLGLPDLYNTLDAGTTSPVGHWDLMATGNYNRPASPAALGAWSRTHLGWADVLTPSDSGLLTLAPVLTSGQILHLPLGTGGEYVLVENRQRLGTDQHLHGEGLLFWAVDPYLVTQRMPTNSLNDDLDAPAVAVLPADNRRDMEENRNDGDATDVWTDTALVDGFGFGTQREVKGRFGSALWSLTELTWSADRTASVMLRFFPDTSSIVIEPEALGPFMAGLGVDIRLRTEPPLEATWSADTAQLRRLGLTLEQDGRLYGTLTEEPGTYTLSVHARVTVDRSVSRTWSVQVLPRMILDAPAIVRALLEGSELDPQTLQLLDAHGNRNGRLDLGDIVLAVRAGMLDKNSLMKVTRP